ncbi:MAG: tRNA uridine-5-carboxymethylaminomethyl(34) synthesis GTPase MnmE [Epsilonproteobacteria bacterium]|nr:tRNA uridine-5-carboxymethylaminomethyl(34) synthesis GTPase MnmE [Campylobacterota bacterium]
MYDNDTIVAIATASGVGAISIIRLSGDDALQIALKITHKETFTPRLATLSKVYNCSNELIDESLIIYFQNPYSFTGEDIVEFQCHGGIALTNMILQATLDFGARLATAGEFSKRAYLNGKIDLSQAEAISKLIEAKSEDGVKLLARQLKGELKEFVEEIRNDLLFILAYVEVSIDYAEEDLPSDILKQINTKLNNIEKKLCTTLESSKRREGMIDGFKVAIVGKPNVGKSSLLNKLLNFDRAIVSNIAGTTRDTIEENIKVGTHIIKIVDTAGIRDASDEIEKIGIEKSKQAIDEADIVIALFDNSNLFDEEDSKINELLQHSTKEKIVVLNKCDLENSFDRDRLEKIDLELTISKSLESSSLKGLMDTLQKILDNNSSISDGMTLVSKHQVLSVEKTFKNIVQSKNILKDGQLEFFAHYVKEALENISLITRPYENDQMLDVMFGEFCLGK